MNQDILGYAALAVGAILLFWLSSGNQQASEMMENKNPLGCVIGLVYLVMMLIVAAGMIYVMAIIIPSS